MANGLNLDDDYDPFAEEEDLVAAGAICADCGAEFKVSQDVPSICKRCWDLLDASEREGYRRAECDTW
jgi:DNA-directed RNA polymerase subunit RPC12/RpoP